eukprot:sb/3469934/
MNSSVTATTWYHNNHPLSEDELSDVTVSDVTSGNDVTSELTLSNTTWDSAGYYYCQGVFDGVGNVTSTPANVFVREENNNHPSLPGAIDTTSPSDVKCLIDFEDPQMTVNSTAVTITVLSVTSSPVDTIGVVGNNATLNCTASGSPSAFKWEHLDTGMVTQGVSRVDNNTSILSVDNIQVGKCGLYLFRGKFFFRHPVRTDIEYSYEIFHHFTTLVK